MQEEARREARDEKMGVEEDQALTVYTKKRKERKSSGSPRKSWRSGKPFDKKDLSHINFYHCNEAGHYKKDCPKLKGQKKKGKPRKHQAHATEDDVSARKKVEDSQSFESEYTLISALTGAITHGSDTWLIDSGASRHMTGNK